MYTCAVCSYVSTSYQKGLQDAAAAPVLACACPLLEPSTPALKATVTLGGSSWPSGLQHEHFMALVITHCLQALTGHSCRG
jgi:hypothetical protein